MLKQSISKNFKMGKQDISVSVDCVIFSVNSKREKILLVKRKADPYKDSWAIPGGFLHDEEPLEDGAARELKEETGLDIKQIHQIRAFGKPNRDPRGRTISVAFYGVVSSEEKVEGADDAAEARWCPLDELPDLAFDHSEIVNAAVEKYRAAKE